MQYDSFRHRCPRSNIYFLFFSNIVKQDHNVNDLGIFMLDDLSTEKSYPNVILL